MESELRDLLRDLVLGTGAELAAIVTERPEHPAETAKLVPLGMGGLLHVRYADDPHRDGRDAALERASRALRACLRRWDASAFPEISYRRSEMPSRNRVLERIRAYLQAFANTQGVHNAAVTSRAEVVTSAAPLADHERDRLPFLLKQVDAEIRSHKGETAHIEIIRDDLCAFAFWVDACLIAYCDGSFSPDFLRHRARMVTREIGQLLPYLDDDPDSPAQIAPIPE